MATDPTDKSRFRRAVFRNALTWGGAWAAAGGVIVAVLSLFSADPGIESLPERIGMAAFAGIAWSVRFGIAGAVIGSAFAAAIRFRHGGRNLTEISPWRFALLGAVVGAVGLPLFLQLMNILSGDGPVAWGQVLDDSVWASLFGAAAAGGSILIARRAEALSRGRRNESLGTGDDFRSPTFADVREASNTPSHPTPEKQVRD